MQPIEAVRVLLFVGVVLAVSISAAVIVVRDLRRRRSHLPPGPPSTRKRLVLAAALAGALCMAWGFLVEPNWLETTHVRIASAKVTHPVRIAFFSDLHCDARPRLDDQLVRRIEEEHPRAIVFGGDAVNDPAGIPILQRCMRALSAIAPTFAVRGNWDVGGGGFAWQDLIEVEARRHMFEGTGVRELDGEAAAISSEVWIAGISIFARDKIPAALAPIPREACTVFVCHWPDEIEGIARRKVDLYLCGHTHGGQVALPFYGALVTFSHYGKEYERGLNRLDETWIYTTRGVGMDGKGAPRVRFCARPELTIVDITPK
jgi:predicted MPP superfamily phosphohydrolase